MANRKKKRSYTSAQLKAIELKNEAVAEIPKLEPFFHGRIPNFDHYKRLNLSREKAIKIAEFGYIHALKNLNVKYYFTQALMYGAAILGTHYNIASVLPSQYGKSFTCGGIAISLGADKQVVSVMGNDSGLTDKVMSEVRVILPKADEEIKRKLTTPVDKFEKMQVSLSKEAIGFAGGGQIQALTLGGKFSDSISGNKAVGQSGNNIIDESATVPDANYAETGRSEVGYREDGRPYLSLEISNPHAVNHFYRTMTESPIAKGKLVIWADIRIAIEEGKTIYQEVDKNAPKMEDTKFFKDESTCIRYLLCEFGATDSGTFFDIRPNVDNSPIDLSEGEYGLGLDSASRGADAVMGAVIKFPTKVDDILRIIDLENFKPNEWVDHETPKLIVNLVVALCKKINIKIIVIDLGGQGEMLYKDLVAALSEEGLHILVKPIMFQNKPTQQRIRPNFNPENGDGNGAELAVNKRAEMHIDLRDLVANQKISFTQKTIDLVYPEMLAIGQEKYTSGGKTQLEDKQRVIKPKLGHSPDSLDAVVMAVHGYILYTLGLVRPRVLEFY